MKKILRLFLFYVFTALFVAPSFAVVEIRNDASKGKGCIHVNIDAAEYLVRKIAAGKWTDADREKAKREFDESRTLLLPGNGKIETKIEVGHYKTKEGAINAALEERELERRRNNFYSQFGTEKEVQWAEDTMEEAHRVFDEQENLIRPTGEGDGQDWRIVKERVYYHYLDANGEEQWEDITLASDRGVDASGKRAFYKAEGMYNTFKQYEDFAKLEKIQNIVDELRADYIASDAKVCATGIENTCNALWPEKDNKERKKLCDDFKKNIAVSAMFKHHCSFSSKAGCDDKTFAKTSVQYSEAVALIKYHEFLNGVKSVLYCSAEAKNGKYISCKSVDGNLSKEYKFDSVESDFATASYNSFSRKVCSLILDEERSGLQACEYVEPQKHYNGSCTNLDKDLWAFFQARATHHELQNAFSNKIDATGCDIDFGNLRSDNHLRNQLKNFGIDNKVFEDLDVRNEKWVEDLLRGIMIRPLEEKGIIVSASGCKALDGTVNDYGSKGWKNFDNNRFKSCWVKVKGKTYWVDWVFKDTHESSKEVSKTSLSALACLAEKNGIFDGKRCLGLQKEECEDSKYGGDMMWSDEFHECVLTAVAARKVATDNYKTAKKVVGAVVKAGIAVIAAVPSGGTSLTLVVGAVIEGTDAVIDFVGAVNEGVSNHLIDEEISALGKALSECRAAEGANFCNEKIFFDTSSLLARYDGLVPDDIARAADSLLNETSQNFSKEVLSKIAEVVGHIEPNFGSNLNKGLGVAKDVVGVAKTSFALTTAISGPINIDFKGLDKLNNFASKNKVIVNINKGMDAYKDFKAAHNIDVAEKMKGTAESMEGVFVNTMEVSTGNKSKAKDVFVGVLKLKNKL